MKTTIYKGKIWWGRGSEGNSTLMVGYNSEPLAERFDDDFYRKQVTIRYWVSDEEKTKKDLQMDTVKQLIGAMDAGYYHRYSDYTGYLWTEQHAKVGGHNLLSELSSHADKFLYMEIDTE